MPFDSKYTPETVQKILNALRAGNYLTTAARYAGVNVKTVQRWMEMYPEFALDVEQADASGEIRNIAIIQKAAERSWQAAAWLNERKYPERWGRVDRVEVYQVQKQAEALVEELKAEGISITVDEVLREREALQKRAQNALPAPHEAA